MRSISYGARVLLLSCRSGRWRHRAVTRTGSRPPKVRRLLWAADELVHPAMPHTGRSCMIRLTCAATAAALLWWSASAVAQTAPASAGPVPAAVIEELVLANRI